jgi:hypothetical protein
MRVGWTWCLEGIATAGGVALTVMHVVTALIAVTAYRKAMPASWPDRQRHERTPSSASDAT